MERNYMVYRTFISSVSYMRKHGTPFVVGNASVHIGQCAEETKMDRCAAVRLLNFLCFYFLYSNLMPNEANEQVRIE